MLLVFRYNLYLLIEISLTLSIYVMSIRPIYFRKAFHLIVVSYLLAMSMIPSRIVAAYVIARHDF